MALASAELNIGPHPIADLVGELNPWLQAERSQGRQLKGISLGLPGIWLHSQLGSASSRSSGKASASSSCDPFSVQPQHQQPPDQCHPSCTLSRVMGRAHWTLGVQIWLSLPERVNPIPSSNPDRKGKGKEQKLLTAFVSESWLPPASPDSALPCLKVKH